MHATYKNVTVAKKGFRKQSLSLHRGRLKVRDNNVHVLFTVWWKKHRLRLLHLHGNRDEHRSRQQECQSDRTYRQLAVILGRPRTCLIIQQREEEVKGREREKKQDIDVKHAVHNHTDKMKRRDRDITLMVMTDCDVSGQDLRDGFIPTAVPAYCVSHKLSEIRLST